MPSPCSAESGIGSPKPERVRFVDADVAGAAFDLVGDQHDRLVGAPQQRGEALVQRRHADARVDQEQDHVGFADRDLGLRAHARFERRVGRDPRSPPCRSA